MWKKANGDRMNLKDFVSGLFEKSDAELEANLLYNCLLDEFKKLGKQMPCKHCGQLSPQEFYKKYVDMLMDDKKIFTIFGKTPQQILEALNFWNSKHTQPISSKEHKMTREEAYKKLLTLNVPNLNAYIEGLVLLGLIKFDEEKKENEGTPPLIGLQNDTFKYAMNTGDKTFLNWIYDRLLHVHGEKYNVDYMLTLKRFVDKWDGEPKLSKRPVAWRVGKRLFTSEYYANAYSASSGGVEIQGLYVRDGT